MHLLPTVHQSYVPSSLQFLGHFPFSQMQFYHSYDLVGKSLLRMFFLEHIVFYQESFYAGNVYHVLERQPCSLTLYTFQIFNFLLPVACFFLQQQLYTLMVLIGTILPLISQFQTAVSRPSISFIQSSALSRPTAHQPYPFSFVRRKERLLFPPSQDMIPQSIKTTQPSKCF